MSSKYQPSRLALAVGSALAVSSAQAATITVTTPDDPGDVSSCSLRSAVEAVNTQSSVDGCAAGDGVDDTIVFDAGLSHSTITLTEGEIEISDALTITGPVAGDPAGITIDGNGDSRIFNIEGNTPSDFELALLSLTLTGGKQIANPAHGGALRAVNADVSLDHALVTGNSVFPNSSGPYARAYGGGLYVRYGNAALLDSTVSDNSVSDGGHFGRAYGGGLHVRDGDAILTGSTVSGNSVTADEDAYGGGLLVRDGNAALTHSMVFDNSAAADGYYAYGGGLFVVDGSAVLNDSTVSGNTASGYFDVAYGGGLFVADGNVILTNSTVSGNSVTGYTEASGGGLRVYYGDAVLTNSTVSSNWATSEDVYGGGLFVEYGNAVLIGSTVSDNSATADELALGGGLFVRDDNVVLTNSTVSGNSATGEFRADGGGLFVPNGNLSLTHATIAFNTTNGGASGLSRGHGSGELILYNSLIVQNNAGGPACNEAADTVVNSLATDDSCTGTATDPADIALGPLANNGGPTETHSLGFPSVAINAAGDCDADFGVTQDQRGQPRPGIASTDCDVGAFELQVPLIFDDRFETE